MRLPQTLPRLDATNFRLSLFIKISAVVVVAMVLVETASFTISYGSASRNAIENMHYVTELRLDDLSEQAAAPVRFNDTGRLEEFVQSFSQIDASSLLGLTVTDQAGNTLISHGDAAALESARTATADASGAEAGRMTRFDLGDGRFMMETPIVTSNAEEPIGRVTSVWTTDPALERAHSDTWFSLGLAGLVVAIMVPLTMLIMRQLISLPMRRLADSLAQIGAGDYDGDIPSLTRGDEIGDFSRHISDLRDRLRIAHEDELARDADHKEQLRVVATLRDGLTALASRNLGVSFDTPFGERYETLREDFNQTVISLRDTINIVIDSVSRMRQGADDMTRSADNLSKRTETQAATLEETAAAIQQISTRVTETATNAREAERIARGAQEKAQVSEPIVREAIDAMAAIQHRSSQISQIITMIDDISFQTNLLALNAGVEAARAGEAGRGFAVVASEVRGLAQRSSDAAREIKELVTGSAEQVNHGVELVRRSGSALSEFAIQVDEIAGLMTTVAQAADDQAHSVTEINVGVGQLDTVTQQNAAMVQETTVAIHELRQQSLDLADVLAEFRTETAHIGGDASRFVA